MADYYPLIARAVAGLPTSTPETRTAIYQRARNALLGQLRRLDPPIPESDVARESAALEIAIARLEADLASPAPASGGEDATGSEVGATAPEAKAHDEPVSGSAGDVGAGDVGASEGEASAPREATEAQAPRDAPNDEPQPIAPPPPTPDAPISTAPAATADGVPAPDDRGGRPRQPPPPAFFKLRRDRPAFSPPPRLDGLPSFRAPRPPAFPPPADPAHEGPARADDGEPSPADPFEATGAADEPARQEPSSPYQDAGDAEGPGADDFIDAEPGLPADPAPAGDRGADGADDGLDGRLSPALAKLRPDAQRPFAPQPPRDGAAPRRLWIVGFVVGLVVLIVAIAAFQLRDRPEELRQKAMAPIIAPEAGSNGKIVDRIGVTPEATQKAPAATSSESATAPNGPAAKGDSDQGTSSGGRAALLLEARDEAAKVKTYLGSVVWKVDNVSNGPADPLSMAVRAEIEIPEEKLQAVVTLQKNVDGSLPASHTMKIQFIEAADSPLGTIQQISVPQMRREDTATGEALSGIPVTIMENSFLIGLTRGTAEAGNLDLLRSREWIDVPMLLANGKIAKLTFEKGPTGVRAITDALAAWKAP